PQGSPCSPVISNLVGHILDARLIRLARKYGCTYTRYADDLTFSTNRKDFPRALARKWLLRDQYIVGKELKKAIEVAGFSINASKTSLQFRTTRQMTTGLVVNEKVNIAQDYYRNVRSMCFSLFQTGAYHIPVKNGVNEVKRIADLDPLEGRLAHVHYVKNVTVRRKRAELDHRIVPYQEPTAPRNLYRRFLFYKYFVANEVPVIVTEGKTDIIYLRTAIKALHAKFPDLVQMEDGKANLLIKFFKASDNNKIILGLAQGFSGMTSFIKSYQAKLRPYGFRPMQHPIIFVVDDDDGGSDVRKAAEKVAGTKFPPKGGERFFPVRDNLYLVLTPPNEKGEPSAIEDCFPKEVLETKLDGKSFNKQKEHGDESSFGKHIFAEKIVARGLETINFSGFEPLLTAISKAISNYQAKMAAAGKAKIGKTA
ncbi:MAG: reverse transcriptase domain-containing protein, partial [Terriglobales bacterium]